MRLHRTKHSTRIVGCTMLLRSIRSSVPRWMVGDALALRSLVNRQQAQLLEQERQIEELTATVSALQARLGAASEASSSRQGSGGAGVTS